MSSLTNCLLIVMKSFAGFVLVFGLFSVMESSYLLVLASVFVLAYVLVFVFVLFVFVVFFPS